jgi:hypothetical protein
MFWLPGISSPIERSFLLECLGKNGFEDLPTNGNYSGNGAAPRDCKEDGRT